MPVWLRVVLVILALGLFAVVSIAGLGWFWWHRHGKEFLESGKASMEAGQKAAATTDQAGCLEAAFQRGPGCQSMGCMLDRNLFFNGCVREARETPGFCDGAPRQTQIMDSVKYRLDQCAKRNLAQDQGCQQLYGEVQKFCERR